MAKAFNRLEDFSFPSLTPSLASHAHFALVSLRCTHETSLQTAKLLFKRHVALTCKACCSFLKP